MTILLTRHDKIGDFVTALPMAKILKEQLNVKVVFLVAKINVILANNIEYIDEVIEYTTDTMKLISRLKKIQADVSISAYIDIHLAFCLYLSNIKIRIAPATKIAQIFFNKRLKQRRSEVKKTEIEYNLDLLHCFNLNLDLKYNRPMIQFNFQRKHRVIFHTGSGGSSEGNISLDDYIELGREISHKYELVFSFGPDDLENKKYIEKKLDYTAVIKSNFISIWDFTQYIATSKLFVSTSTGPMHLAGLTNTPTVSFFGSSTFASSRRWSTVSDRELQNNYEIPHEYTHNFLDLIKKKLIELL